MPDGATLRAEVASSAPDRPGSRSPRSSPPPASRAAPRGRRRVTTVAPTTTRSTARARASRSRSSRSRHRGFGGTSTPLDSGDRAARPPARHGRLRSARRAAPTGPGRSAATELEPYYDRAHASARARARIRPRTDGSDGDSPTPLAWDGGPQLAMFQFAPHDMLHRRYDDARSATPTVDVVLHRGQRDRPARDDGARCHRAGVVAPPAARVHRRGRACSCWRAGGIDNARVLLASPGRHGDGVGNEHDNVGRYFMDHLSVDSGVIVPAGAAGTSPSAAFREQRQSDGPATSRCCGWATRIIEREGLPNAAFWVDELDSSVPLGGRRRGALAARRDAGRPRAQVVSRHAHRRRARCTSTSPPTPPASSAGAFRGRRCCRCASSPSSSPIASRASSYRDAATRSESRRSTSTGGSRAAISTSSSTTRRVLGHLLAEQGVATAGPAVRSRSAPVAGDVELPPPRRARGCTLTPGTESSIPTAGCIRRTTCSSPAARCSRRGISQPDAHDHRPGHEDRPRRQPIPARPRQPLTTRCAASRASPSKPVRTARAAVTGCHATACSSTDWTTSCRSVGDRGRQANATVIPP